MKYFFWQNTNSIHQSAFFKALAAMNIGEVTLIVTMNLPGFRKEMGWSEPELSGVHVIYLDQIHYNWQQIIDQNKGHDCIHIFSGIAAFENVQKAFVHAKKNKCRTGIFTEPLDLRGFKGKLRLLRGYYHKLLYGSFIEFILPTGKNGIAQFETWGYSKSSIFEWAYTVENSAINLDTSNFGNQETKFRLMFAGSLIHRKGYDILIKALCKIDHDFLADFYCLKENEMETGKLIESESGLNGKLRLLAFLSNKDLRSKMNEYDLFVLPSRHDGWGAVVCESLMEGTPVLVSRFCGSSSIMQHPDTGKVLQSLDENDLAIQIDHYLKAGKLSVQQRANNREWAQKNISGTAMAAYFHEIVTHLNMRLTTAKPQAPWMKKDEFATSPL
ncbi:glycosyltransferase family 4 protein [Dyadobacter sediminis]|nr:glycosyltransferase [Dyadobacter sediminis]